MEQAANGIVVTDIKGKIQSVNPAFRDDPICQREAGEYSRILESGLEPVTFYEQRWSTIRSGRIWRGDAVNRRKDGTFYDEEMRITPVLDGNGGIVSFAIKHDLTERQAGEEARRFLAAVVDSSEDVIMAYATAAAILWRNSRKTGPASSAPPEGLASSSPVWRRASAPFALPWNRGAEAAFGYSAGDAIGKHVSMLAPPERSTRFRHVTEQVLQGDAVSQYRSICLRQNGRRIHVSITGSPIGNSAGDYSHLAHSS